MSKSSSQDFLRGVPRRQAKVLHSAGLGVIVTACAVVVFAVWILPKFDEPSGMPISIDVPFVGPGVTTGTKVILRGGEVGEVVRLERTDSESVRLDLELDHDQISGLTDTFDVDFRPRNYFGSTAVNLVSRSGGVALASGATLERLPLGDFTMSTMIEKGSLTIDGTLTDSMITTLNKTIRYTDGLTPLFDAGLIFADRVAQTQRELPSELLAYLNDVLGEMPAFNRAAIDALTSIYYSVFNVRPDGSIGVHDPLLDEADQGLALAATKLFGQAGALLASHGDELTPVTQVVATIADMIPHLREDGAQPERLREAIESLDNAFSDTDTGKRLDLRIVLDDIPSLAVPLGITRASAPLGEGAGQ
ncbi:Mce family protein [Rhodococcus sp. KBS0724]|uniref:Mce family protein n=1 Tax=Rhodococcus sp. KBS0724 TaxID=1179674 RepID=UPI00110F2E5E|nr:Mce family protein [Rhodococcus sp. KBS0724]TSD45764.1 Mce family protein [Rhodococcus sp. KBS0724]